MLWRASAILLAAVAVAGAQQEAPEAELAIVRLELLDSPNGYAIPDDSVFYPGEQTHLTFNVTGYRITEDYRMKVSYRISTLSPLDKPFAMAEGGEWDLEMAPQDEGWEPLAKFTATIPSHAGSGLYNVKIVLTDHIANRTVTRRFPIRVDGVDVETSEALTVRNFAFAASEGGEPLEQPSVRPGASLWASFYITGYLTGSDNAYDVDSEMKIVNEEGKTVLELGPQGEKGSPFYPRLWLPASFRLDLDSTSVTGVYTVILEVRDKVGKTAFERQETFRVH